MLDKGDCPKLNDPEEIEDDDFSASSEADTKECKAYHARLNGKHYWSTFGSGQWISVTLSRVEIIMGVATQGSPYHDCFVTKYKIKYKQSNNSQMEYKEGNEGKVSSILLCFSLLSLFCFALLYSNLLCIA